MKNSYRIGIVISRFNQEITDRLLEGAKRALNDHGIVDCPIFYVPGAYEIPLVCKKMAETSNFDAIVTLGAVIRGETSHYEYVCGPMAHGIASVSLESGIPILFGVLTTENEQQAIERSKPDQSNKGYEVVLGAFEMIEVMDAIAFSTS
jgi:6,7-dimethyl-8-ribityllumazine synthase